MNRLTKPIFLLLSSLLITRFSFAQDSVQVVTAWIKKNSFPIESVVPTKNFSDLQPLKRILQDVEVIGLGEGTHGTREFFQMKDRLLRFLVTEMGFTGFTMEASYTACQPANDYVLTGKGDKAAVLTGLGYMAWDTEEFEAMLDWMRSYNQTVAPEKKVKFYGLDVLCCHELGRQKVLAFLKQYAPEKVAGTDSLFRVLASEDVKWPTRLNQDTLQRAFLPLHELRTYINENKDELVSASSMNTWEEVAKYLEVMEQSLFVNVEEVPPSLSHLKKTRSEFMADNLFYLLDKEKPSGKFMYWAHNYHISTDTAKKTTGYYLQKRLGNAYYGLAFHAKQGTFQTRVLLPDGFWGELKADTISSVPKSLEWYLSEAGLKDAFFHLRTTVPNAIVQKWLKVPIRINTGHWVYRGTSLNHESKILKGLYDGIVYIERSTPVRPTKNATSRSSKNIGF